jgi:hypothetical protein
MLKGLGVDLANIGKTKKEKKAEAKAKKEAKKEDKKATDLPKEKSASGGKLKNKQPKNEQPEPMKESRVVNESFDSSLGKVEDQGMEQEDAINSTSDNPEDPEPIANDDAGIESRLGMKTGGIFAIQHGNVLFLRTSFSGTYILWRR